MINFDFVSPTKIYFGKEKENEVGSIISSYGFKKNKGYPTKKHVEAIMEYGIIKEHRKTFKPVCDYLDKINVKSR